MIHLPAAITDIGPAALVIAAAAALAGLSRGFSGFGGALVFMPIASALVGPTVAVPIFLLCDAVMAAPLIPQAIRKADWRDIRPILAGAFLGLPVGNWVLTHIDPGHVRWAISFSIGMALVVLASGFKFKGEPGWRTRAGVGGISGLLAGLASIGGPPVIVYWLSTSDAVAQMRYNLLAFFATTSVLSIGLFAWRGLLTSDVLWLVLLCAPGYGVGIWLGTRMFSFASPDTYRRIAYALVGLSAVTSLPVLDSLMGRGR